MTRAQAWNKSSPSDARQAKRARFPATRWSLVVAAQDEDDEPKAQKALAELAEIYEQPVRAFLLAQGRSESQSLALMREFFDGLAARAKRGSSELGGARFRTWLVAALRDFVGEKSGETQALAAADPFASTVRAALDSDPEVCLHCGVSLGSEVPAELCAACLLAGAVDTAPEYVGDYEIIEEIGRGGMSIVYRARQSDVEPEVALKMLKPELVGKRWAIERFRKSVEIAGKLEHPNIARVHAGAGLYAEVPFFTMQLIRGGTLADPERKSGFRKPRDAARLLVKIARAVQFAHARGVLHLDLKPDNILLSEAGEPYVSDFMARRVRDRGSATVVGALDYMAPEQARGQAVTTATDVHGLGAIFYELLTGRPPIEAETLEQCRELHASGTLTRPSVFSSGLDRELEAICLAALDKNPARRHASAASFADGLERVLHGKPPLFPPIPWQRRAQLWVRRHPLLAVSAVIGMLLLLFVDVMMFAGARLQHEELRNATLRSNAALASAQAQAVLAAFRKYADHTLQGSSEPAVQQLLEQRQLGGPAPGLAEVYERARSFGLDAVFVVDPQGVLRARWPLLPTASVGKNYRFRDYFKCGEALAKAGSRDVCMSPAYRSEAHEVIQFAFAAPVYGADDRWLGILVMSRNAQQTLAEVEIGDSYGSGQITAVFGPRGVDRSTAAAATPPPERMIAVIHSRLGSSEEYALDGDLTARLRQKFGRKPSFAQFAANSLLPLEDGHYRDLLSDPRDRWLAGFAPIGNTGYVTVVATPHEKALGPSQRLIGTLSMYGGLLNLSFLLIAAVAVAASLREAKSSSERGD